jgi:hypothetical protein
LFSASWYYKVDVNQFCFVSGGHYTVNFNPTMYGNFRVPAANQNQFSRHTHVAAVNFRTSQIYFVAGVTIASSTMADIWQLDGNSISGVWSWIEGNNVPADATGSYPSGKGVAFSRQVAYQPGAMSHSVWTDQSGGLW